MSRVRIRVHIVREDPVAAGFEYGLCMIAREILRAEGAYPVAADFFKDLIVAAARASIFGIDE